MSNLRVRACTARAICARDACFSFSSLMGQHRKTHRTDNGRFGGKNHRNIADRPSLGMHSFPALLALSFSHFVCTGEYFRVTLSQTPFQTHTECQTVLIPGNSWADDPSDPIEWSRQDTYDATLIGATLHGSFGKNEKTLIRTFTITQDHSFARTRFVYAWMGWDGMGVYASAQYTGSPIHTSLVLCLR